MEEIRVQDDLFPERGGFELQGFDFLIKNFGKDQLGDAHIAHQEFKNNVVYGVGYSYGRLFSQLAVAIP